MAKTDVKVKMLDDRAVMPSRSHDTDSGYDLTMIGIHKIQGDVIFFKTGIAVQPPSGYYVEIVPRSSISNYPLMLANSIGVIDHEYTGEIIVPIRVLHDQLGKDAGTTIYPNGLVKIFDVRPASMSSIAGLILQKKPCLTQLILRKRNDCTFSRVEDLKETERGDGGFGSTDVLN